MTVTILLVDDVPAIQNLVRAVFSHRGMRVEAASTGAEGICKARLLQPDLVIMDIDLPDMDGLLAAYLIRSTPETRDIPVLAISGGGTPDLGSESENVGCLEFIAKPFHFNDLADRVLNMIAARQQCVA